MKRRHGDDPAQLLLLLLQHYAHNDVM